MKATSLDDIIAAVSTPPGPGGIAIVRMSGDGCIALAQKVFRGQDITKKESHTITYGHIVDPQTGKDADEVLVTVMRAPKTYTREDVVEINCHGGHQAAGKILSILFGIGARMAEPGEFTKRAFLNGRIDLSQAEAVIDVITAKTDLSREIAVGQLSGHLARRVHEIRDKLLSLMASIEVTIDYPEHDVEEETSEMLLEKIGALFEQTNALLRSANQGRTIREGISAAILGKPNVGKSSLLNALLEEERAIVTDVAGTTRDTVEEFMNIGGVPLKIIDTAGIRETKDTVEKIGVQKARDLAIKAQLVFWVVDASRPLEAEDKAILPLLQKEKTIVLLNKADLPMAVTAADFTGQFDSEQIFSISAKKAQGLEQLGDYIKERFLGGKLSLDHTVMIQNARHQAAVQQAAQHLQKAMQTVRTGMPVDFVSMDLMEAYHQYGLITGESVEDDLIDRIFSEFCLGK